MAEQSFPFENIDTTESQFSQWATNFQDTGVQGNPSDSNLKVTAEGSTLTVSLAAGQAFIRGHYYINTEAITLTIPSAGLDTRIDYVVIELDPALNTITAKTIQGTAVASDPVAPTLTQTATAIYQLPVAMITIPTSTLAITNEMLTDVRTFMSNRVGIWTTNTRPENPVQFSTMGYNTTINAHEFWNGTAWVGFADPISTEGDLIVGGASGVPERLPIGADDQVLTVVDGEVAWADSSSGGGFYYKIVGTDTKTVSIPAGVYHVSAQNPVVLSNGLAVASGQPIIRTFDSEITSIVYDRLASWSNTSNGSGTTLNAAVYSDSLFVTAGDSGVLFTSTDAITWTARTSRFGTTNIIALTFGNGVYVAGGSGGVLTTSTDAITWTTRTSGFGTFDAIYSLTFGNNVYVAGGNNGQIRTSTDAITWTARTSGFGTTNIIALTFGNGVYVAGGSGGVLTTSTDAITWTTRTSGFGSTSIRALTFGNNLFVAAGEGGTLTTSTNAITWTTRTSGFGTTTILALTFGNGVYVAAGAAGQIRTSTDGITWTSRTTSAAQSFNAATYGDGTYLAVGVSGQHRYSAPATSDVLFIADPKPVVTI